MPEGLEAEIWRRAATALVGRTIERVWVDERVAPPGLADELPGASIDAVHRVGKIVVLDLLPPAGPGDRSSSRSPAASPSLRRLGLTLWVAVVAVVVASMFISNLGDVGLR